MTLATEPDAGWRHGPGRLGPGERNETALGIRGPLTTADGFAGCRSFVGGFCNPGRPPLGRLPSARAGTPLMSAVVAPGPETTAATRRAAARHGPPTAVGFDP